MGLPFIASEGRRAPWTILKAMNYLLSKLDR